MNRTVVVMILLSSAGCASGSSAPPGGTAVDHDGAAQQAAIVDSVRTTYTRADVAFMAGMIHHHAQALEMSRLAPSHGASADLRILAERIINAQNDEIDLMQRWLRDRGEHVPTVGGGPAHDGAMMPGMLTADQMAALDAARGEEFDRLYLQFMIQHHQGAVTMVEELVASPGGAREESVFKLASDIGADQSSEITRMQTMLRDLLFAPDDGP